jgi:hypothetical protein
VWDITDRHVNKTPHNNSDSLILKIKEVMGSLDRETVARACRQFWSRIEAMVEADGDFIEYRSEHNILSYFLLQ